jgi:hypothetical protein
MKYPNSSIYKLVLNDEVYYGSTVENLKERFSKHKSNFKRFQEGKTKKRCSAFTLFEKDCENVKCELVELFPCDERSELHKRERFFIENNTCINKLMPTRTIEEYKIACSEKIKASKAKWSNANRTQIKTRANTKIACECGGKYTLANKSVHLRSKKHSRHGL